MIFLNDVSDTGCLNTILSLIIELNGVNHASEIHADVVEFASEKLTSQ